MADREHRHRSTAALILTLFASTILAYYIIKPVRDALYLRSLGAENLPLVYLAQAFLAGGFVWIENRMFDRLRRPRFFVALYLFLVASLIVFWVALGRAVPPEPLVFAFHLWMSLFFLVAVALFWSLSNEVYDLRTGKRWYGLVGASGLVGGIVGAQLARVLLSHVSPINLIPVGAAVLSLCIPLSLALIRRRSRTAIAQELQWPQGHDGLYYVLRYPYLTIIAAVILLMNVVAAGHHVQAAEIFSRAFLDVAELTHFNATLNLAVSAAGLALQLVVAPFVLRARNPAWGLIALPLLETAAAVVYIVGGTLEAVSVVFVLSSGVAYSLNQSVKEILYIPLLAEVKYKAKAYIDVMIFRCGDALGAFLLLVLLRGFGWKLGDLPYATFLLALLWIALVALLAGRSQSTLSQ